MFIQKIISTRSIVSIIFLCVLFIFSLLAMESNYNKIVVVGDFGVGGSVTGKACIIVERKQIDKVCKGNIVVAYTTHSSWDKALRSSSGIITETGGDSSHAVLLGKRLGIPVIVGATGATKKIVHGSLITLDCSKKAVYDAVKNDCFQFGEHKQGAFFVDGSHSVYNYKPSHYDLQSLGEEVEGNQKNNLSIIDAEKKIIKNSNDTHNRYYNGIDFTLDRLQQDKPGIKSYINEVRRNIERSEAWYVNKLVACQIGRISEKVYHCRPLEFFKNMSEVEKVSDAELDKPETVEYIGEGFSDFVKQGVSVTNETLGNFLFNKLVDNMKIEEADKEILKKNPERMNDFVRESGTIRDEYMKINVRNLSIQYYLEKHYK